MASSRGSLDYRGKIILAPMVRIGALPKRLLALEYGADLVYSEEIIDFKILKCKRVENVLLGTTDFVLRDGTAVFRTCTKEKGKVVFQMGTANAQRALKAAKMVEGDVAAVDVNMGCPKDFSIHAGMGAALLTQPEKIKEILTTLVNGLSIPVTCKIRILPTVEETVKLAKLIESTGVAALAVHGRTKEQRPRHENQNHFIKAVAEALTIPVIANGGSKNHIRKYEDIEWFRLETGADSVMIARTAEWNTSVFRKEGMLPTDEVIKAYLKIAIDYNNNMTNTKYTVQQYLHENLNSPVGEAVMQAELMRDLCAPWGLVEYLEETEQKRRERAETLIQTMADEDGTGSYGLKKRKLNDGSEIIEMPIKFIRKEYEGTGPKMILYEWTKKNNLQKPVYDTEQKGNDRCFQSVVTVDGKKFSSCHWEKSKKYAENAAAIVCLQYLGLHDERKLNIVCPIPVDGVSLGTPPIRVVLPESNKKKDKSGEASQNDNVAQHSLNNVNVSGQRQNSSQTKEGMIEKRETINATCGISGNIDPLNSVHDTAVVEGFNSPNGEVNGHCKLKDKH
ncbi:tRNA-dihydrouridine(20) synthase [NAD(P)+]-like isoform X1 [Lingula anatina]|uniref:tRNA-dihydrouridine(20) synthase [NAD(P)+]-like isoform X1 n=3 Tax=Lingula anatina TaxID=7574 RepID=A0A1S3J214_LINAN|nr:tRNA-dihydrouridine(20) synthase [NAD(P)+]-like isoform X1 [Lingula anatina]XP_013404466.1 tRNA-dihydrouridine(20) synthase [NAD(P)+]-like isoform X2 [Lingula anatina]XP_013404467.1 tRNA-dihydrouridine(20) synthase [NAD(P)+]-like isoform X1 [Lingula anatina]|eukprot:XP_013404465.1 tRNA-dihydrouridine(20) synthase [NAD(P)+]-like isoform X1 [Lingula anatina]